MTHTLNDLIKAYVGNDGRIHVVIESDIVVHTKGEVLEINDKNKLSLTHKDEISITGNELHLNPVGDLLDTMIDYAQTVSGISIENNYDKKTESPVNTVKRKRKHCGCGNSRKTQLIRRKVRQRAKRLGRLKRSF